ncbi:MAG: IS4 family transposase [Deltaproteobacteria bacterium]|nr:IS4 family transposase [Deltaproteobacteria bacterium]
MPQKVKPFKNLRAPSFVTLYRPVHRMLPQTPVLQSKGDRPLKMSFEDQLQALIFFHLEEHTSGRHLVQVLKEDDYAREHIAPKDGIEKSSFFEAINNRGLEQLQFIYEGLCNEASGILPHRYSNLGELVAIDGSLIDAVMSMAWADYRKNSKKAKIHMGFNINQGIPSKFYLTNGNGAERPFVPQIISPGQTGIGDRGYQDHAAFDSLQVENKSFVIRIKANTTKTLVRQYDIDPGSIVFYDAEVLLGTRQNNNQTQTPVRLVAYRIDKVDYWVATDRRDLTAEEIAEVYKLRWEIESFFAWWKRHLKVYHLIARSPYGLMVQIYAGLITYLLLAIYCHETHGERVSIKRVRELRIQIENELRDAGNSTGEYFFKEQNVAGSHAKT